LGLSFRTVKIFAADRCHDPQHDLARFGLHIEVHMASRYYANESTVSAVTGNSAVSCPGEQHAAGSESPRVGLQLSGRGPLGTVMGVQILSAGSYLPDEVVRNEDLEQLGCDAEWILQRTGIHERRRAASNEATSDLAYQAAVSCLEQAGVAAEEVDLILVATTTPDMLMPSTACMVQRRLGAVAAAMDINAACSGFMYALVTGMQFVHSGCSRRVLVIGSDIMSRIINPDDKKTYPLFGDGAGAVLIGPGNEDQGLLSFSLGSEGDDGELLCLPGGGSREPLTAEGLQQGRQYLQMDGRAVFKWAVRLINDISLDVVRHAEMEIDDLDLVVLHQANVRIIDAAVDALGVDRDRVYVNLDRLGNTTAASIPIALDELMAADLIQRGDHVLMEGFGAGLTWGAGVLRF
jgi:3-oxoacyl-[acyl-carrier-protein] synthase-3